MNIYQKLNLARKKFHALKLEKTGLNKFAGYKYFELADFLIPALTIFEEVGLCAIISFDKEMAKMTIVDSISDGMVPNALEITSPMGSAQLKGCHEVQNIGAVETYQRRYLWVAALEIVEHDALDATTGVDDKTINPVKEAMKGIEISEHRRSEIEEMAIAAVNYFKAGNNDRALELAHEIEDNEEKLFFWDLLKTESKLRAFIKANPRT